MLDNTLKIVIAPFIIGVTNLIIVSIFITISKIFGADDSDIIKYALMIFVGAVIVAAADHVIRKMEASVHFIKNSDQTKKMDILWIGLVIILPSILLKILVTLTAWDVGGVLVIAMPIIIIIALRTRQFWIL